MWETTVIQLKAVPKQIWEGQDGTINTKATYLAGWIDGTEAQAETTGDIAYKAGRDSMIDEMVESINTAQRLSTKAGKKAGIHEVVEWIQAHSQLEKCDPAVMAYFIDYLAVDYPDWQAKLKEWGIQ